MGKFIATKDYIAGNIFKFEERLNSQYSIFLDSSPTFVTYYHINDTNSTADIGFQNVENMLGKNSPVRYNRIEDFPIYGLDEIQLDLSEEEQGLDSTYDGDAIILPSTIKPLPGDIFIIKYLNKDFLFTVNTIQYDTIKSNNYYKIGFHLRSTSEEERKQLESQIFEKYDCVFTNIGTDDKCIIKSEDFQTLHDISFIYDQILERYLKLFYSKRYNSLTIMIETGKKLYDRYLTHFINENGLFNSKDTYDSIWMSNEDDSSHFILEYESSFFQNLEDREIDTMGDMKYTIVDIMNPDSIFRYYNNFDVKSMRLLPRSMPLDDYIGFYDDYMPKTLMDNIRANNVEGNVLEQLVIRYFHDSIETWNQIDVEGLRKYRMQMTRYDMIMIPITLFILRHYISQYMKDKSN